MKKFVKWCLNHVPRPAMQRLAGWSVPLMGLCYKGKGRECPLCGAEYRRFLPYGYVVPRPDALCPRCLALDEVMYSPARFGSRAKRTSRSGVRVCSTSRPKCASGGG